MMRTFVVDDLVTNVWPRTRFEFRIIGRYRMQECLCVVHCRRSNIWRINRQRTVWVWRGVVERWHMNKGWWVHDLNTRLVLVVVLAVVWIFGDERDIVREGARRRIRIGNCFSVVARAENMMIDVRRRRKPRRKHRRYHWTRVYRSSPSSHRRWK